MIQLINIEIFTHISHSHSLVLPQSATIQTEHFASYLTKWLNTPATVPVLFIPGFTFPVVEFYKGDYEGQVRAFRDFVPGAGE